MFIPDQLGGVLLWNILFPTICVLVPLERFPFLPGFILFPDLLCGSNWVILT